MLLQDDASEHYGPDESRRRHFIRHEWLPTITKALGDSTPSSQCEVSANYVDRLPAAPSFSNEEAYFEYLGAVVPSAAAMEAREAPANYIIAGDTVFILKHGEHFELISGPGGETVIEGSPLTFCRIATNHRVVLSVDLAWTYIVTNKDLTGSHSIRLTLRRARPISNVEPIQMIIGGIDA